MDTEPIGASSAEMDQPTGAVAEIPASPMEMQIIATVILFVRMEPKKKKPKLIPTMITVRYTLVLG